MKPWEISQTKNSSFNEFYTTYEQCDTVLGEIKRLGFLDSFKTICCPCDGAHSNIVKWLQNNTKAKIVYFDYLDCNSSKARQMMLKCGCVITNPPYDRKIWIPFFMFLHESKIPYFIWGSMPSNTSKSTYNLDYLFYIKTDNCFERPDGKIAQVNLTCFYTNFDVPYPDYEYEPAEKAQFYKGIPLYDHARNVPKDYMGWFLAPFSMLKYLKHYDIDEKLSKEGGHGKYIRFCLRRKTNGQS